MKGFDGAAARKTAIVIAVLAAIETAAIAVYPKAFLPQVVRHAAEVPLLGWALALVVVAGYTAYALRGLPTIASYLPNMGAFKIWGIVLAVPSAIVEEVFFRQSLMNAFAHSGAIVQIAISASVFGLAHSFWAIRGGRRAFAGAVGSTTFLGAALAVVFLASNRIVVPCICAHFLINAILEPWLVYAYVLRSQNPGRRALTLTLRQPVG